MFESFHFLHPEFFYILAPVWLIVFWLLHSQDSAQVWKNSIDKRFLPYLLDGNKEAFFKAPFHLGILLSLIIIALGAPAYKMKEQTQSNERSEVVFVLKVSDSMLAKDLMPTRLKRAVFKIDDFLTLRQDLRSSLVAYSGSAHLVMPLTRDKDIINSFANSLSPEMMPVKGDALYEAVLLASRQFMEVDGTIVVLADSASKKQLELIEKDKELNRYKTVFYSISSEVLKGESLRGAIDISFDTSDIDALSSEVDHQFSSALGKKEGRFENSGYELLPLIVLYMLFFFRSGFIGELWRLR